MIFVALILVFLATALGQQCGDTKKMDCKADCPTTNGQEWDNYKTTDRGCCKSFWSCFGARKHCRFDCDQCVCPSGYQAKDQVTSTKKDSQERLEDCCQMQCKPEHCDGAWELKSEDAFCEGHECPKNTAMCCTYRGFNARRYGEFARISIHEEGQSSSCTELETTIEAGGLSACSARCSANSACNVFNWCPHEAHCVDQSCSLRKCEDATYLELTMANSGWDVYSNGFPFTSGDTIEIVKNGKCETWGYEPITDEAECALAANIIGVRNAPNYEKGTDSSAVEYCGTYDMEDVHFNPMYYGVDHADGYQHMICKGHTATQLKCGAYACAYYYTDVGGDEVEDLLESSEFRKGEIDTQQMLTTNGMIMNTDWDDEYGIFVEAWVMAPYTGNFNFKTKCDNSCVLYVSIASGTKHGTFAKAVESDHDEYGYVESDTDIWWEEGHQYYVYGYMKEKTGADFWSIGLKHASAEWDVIPADYLAGGGCVSIMVENVIIVGTPTIIQDEENAPIREQTVFNADNCGSTSDVEVTISAGQTTSVTTTWEQTKETSWTDTWGLSGSLTTTVTAEYESGWVLKAVGGSGKGKVEVTASAEMFQEQETSGSDSTTHGSESTTETYAHTEYKWDVYGESKTEVLITGSKYNYEVEWQGDSICKNAAGEQVGQSKRVGGTYKSFGYTNIDFVKSDGICTGYQYCQPDVETLAANLHIDDPSDIYAENLFQAPLDAACDMDNGGVDCSDLPIQCRDGQEQQARWVYSKYYIEKCSGDYDHNNPCVCSMPVDYQDRSNIPTAGMTLADTDACTYGLPGSHGYDSIPTEHQDTPQRTQSSMSVKASELAAEEAAEENQDSDGIITIPGLDGACDQEVGMNWRGTPGNEDLPNMPLTGIADADTCSIQCSASPDCEYYSYDTANDRCWLKKNFERKESHANTISGYPCTACPSVTVTFTHGNDMYFNFDKDAWLKMTGESEVSGYWTVKQTGSTYDWEGKVVVWDNHNGVHGRRQSGASSNQWSKGDEISIECIQ